MESADNSIHLLSMFTHPVFLVKDGIILGANHGAQALQIPINTSVFDLLRSGQDEYRSFQNGSLSLTVGVGPINMVAAVFRVAGTDYFHLLCGNEATDLQALSLASQQLRDPISNIIALTDNLFNQQTAGTTPKDKHRIAQLNQNLHRLLRSVGNMSDINQYSISASNKEYWNIGAIITDAVETAKQQIRGTGHQIEFTAENDEAAGLADRDMLERAVYNMLSNAIRHGDPNGTITASVRCSKKVIRFTVENSCKEMTADQLGSIFFRYRRTPSVTDGNTGHGLGILIIQSVASAHNGSVLVTMPERGRIRFCLTIPVMQDKRGTLRSPSLRPDYTGGYNRSLIELSDVLPSDNYLK